MATTDELEVLLNNVRAAAVAFNAAVDQGGAATATSGRQYVIYKHASLGDLLRVAESEPGGLRWHRGQTPPAGTIHTFVSSAGEAFVYARVTATP